MYESRISEEEALKVKIIVGSEIDEASKLMPLVKLAHKESYFSDLPFEEDTYLRICQFAKDKPAYYGALYVEYDGEPAGFAFYMYRPMSESKHQWMTIMHGIYVRNDLRATDVGGYIWNRMLTAVRVWGAPRSSRGIMFNVTSGFAMAETDAILRANGATYLGGNYFLRG